MLPPAIAAASERQDLTDEFSCPLACAANFFEMTSRAPARISPRGRHFRVTQDRADDIIEIMGDPAGKGADRLHPPGLLQVRLQPLLLLFEIDSGNGVGDGVERHAE